MAGAALPGVLTYEYEYFVLSTGYEVHNG
jgi:hypothetical protein